MSNLKNRLLTHAKRARYSISPLKLPPKFLHKNVPYFSQWESKELAKQILEKKISTDDDPKWRKSGAKTKQEYHDWSWSGCGMACTKMILAHRTGKVVPLVELGKKCASYGGYTVPLTESAGLYYKPYLEFVSNELGWQARIAQGMHEQELMNELSQGNYIIASVSPKIRYPSNKPKIKGGHLILLLGYDKSKQEFYLHNPSGISKDTQGYAVISFRDFKKFFSGRAIVIQS